MSKSSKRSKYDNLLLILTILTILVIILVCFKTTTKDMYDGECSETNLTACDTKEKCEAIGCEWFGNSGKDKTFYCRCNN